MRCTLHKRESLVIVWAAVAVCYEISLCGSTATEPRVDMRTHEAAEERLELAGGHVLLIWALDKAGKAKARTFCEIGDDWHGDETDFEFLKDLTNLRKVDVRNQATDNLLAVLGTIDSLRIVELDGGTISNDGVKKLSRLPQLFSVAIHSPLVTDRAMCALSKIRTLTDVDIGGCNVGDSGIKQLLRLPRLEVVGLEGTSVSDECIELLVKCESLEEVSFVRDIIVGDAVEQSRKSKVSRKAMETLRARRPDVEVRE